MKALSLAFLGSLLLVGCAADPVGAERRHLRPQPVVDFPAEDLALDTNAIFLWKKEVTAEQVSRMAKLGDAFGLAKRQLAGLTTALAAFPPAEALEMAGELEKLEKRRQIEKQLGETREKLVALRGQVQGECDDFASPPLVSFRFEGGRPLAEIRGWEVAPGVVRDFSSEARTIAGLTYTVRGGVFQFAVPVDGSVYQFQLSRSNYERHEKGVATFYGEIVKKLPDGKVRFGAAKLVGSLPTPRRP